MVDIFFWAAFGFLIGWIAAILHETGQTSSTRTLALMIAGVCGGIVGGLCGIVLEQGSISRDTTTDMLFAIFGAVACVFILSFTAHKRTGR